MEDKKLPEFPDDDKWLEELLSTPELGAQIGADEQAVSAAGLTDPSDLELEKIIQETLSENWGVEQEQTHLPESKVSTPEEDVTPEPAPQTTDPTPPPSVPSVFLDDEFRDTFGEGEILDQIFSDQPLPEPKAEDPVAPPEPEPEPKQKEAEDPLEKGRPKKRPGYGLLGLPHIAATVIWLAIIIAIGVSVGRMAWLCVADVLAFGRGPRSVTLTIEQTDTIDDIAQKLKDAELISYPELFKLYADLSGAMEDIRPGTYFLNPPEELTEEEMIVYDYMALVSAMSPHSSGLTVVEDLRIPEGYTCAQIFQLLEDNNVCTVAELEAYAASGELDDYWFLEGMTRGDKYCLEGYLFPNTYDFYENDEPERVLEKMLDAFDASFTDVMKQKLEGLDGYTIREVVIIASMIEKEAANDLESFTVSSVIYNRLRNADAYPYLNIDATIVYALGGKADLTEEDLQVDSPYNTYTNKGLPPGPISNPSQNSIAAALDPEDTNYYFYAFDPSTQEHHFSSTYAEHQAFLDSLKEDE